MRTQIVCSARTLVALIVIFTGTTLNAQEVNRHYDISFKKNLGYYLFSSATYFAGQMANKNVSNATRLDILTLSSQDIRSFDRGAISNLSQSAENASDIMLFGSLALPLTCYISGEVGQEGLAMAIMLTESILVVDGMTNLIKGTVKRYRPFTYNSDVPINEKLTSEARLSFISGHTSITAAMTFLSARVLVDLHPDSPLNPLIWTSAAIFPALTGFFRFRAGKHFPSDIIGGYLLGAGVGLLIPSLHHQKHLKISPSASGLSLVLSF